MLAGRSVRSALAVVGMLAFAACGTSSDDGAQLSPASTIDDGASASSVEPSTSQSTTPTLIGPLLQLCDDVPVLATDVIGNDPTGFHMNPYFDGVLLTYAAEHPDTYAGIWFDREAGGTMVLAFTDEPGAHLAAVAARSPSPDDVRPLEPMPPLSDERPIGEWGIAFDVVQATYTEAELLAGIGSVSTALYDAGFTTSGTGSAVMINRVSVVAAQPTTTAEAAAMAAAIAEVLPLDMVCLEGTIVDSRPDPIEPGTQLDVIVLPDANGTYPPDTEVRCGGTNFTLADLQSLTPIEAADPGLKAVVDGWIADYGNLPADGWLVLTETDDRATMVRLDGGSFSVIRAEMGRNGWVWASSSGESCDVSRRLPDGMGVVTWEFDPAFPAPDASTTELHLWALEAGCTGGSEMGDRLLGPQVVETDDEVRIVFASIPLIGDQNCPGNPPAAVTVVLDQPLGDRELLDGLLIGPLRELLPD